MPNTSTFKATQIKMKRLFTFLLLAICTTSCFAEWTDYTISFDGKERSYTIYVPAMYNPAQPATFIVALHGLGGSMHDIDPTGITQIADTANIIIVSPQALDFASPMGLIEAAWNNGIAVTVPGLGSIAVNADVDDAGFINAIMDTVLADYTINPDRVYVCGMSMGGFMAQMLTCAFTDRFTAAASLSGTYALALPPCTPSKQIPVAHFHGTADEVITYEGYTYFPVLGEVPVGLSVNDLIDQWTAINECSAVPEEVNIADANGDGISMDHYIYKNESGRSMVELFRINGGAHAWYDVTATGGEFDYATEVWKFFNKQFHTMSISSHDVLQLVNLYPNPASNVLYIQTAQKIKEASIFDFIGKKIADISLQDGSTDISLLPNGIYFVKVHTDTGYGVAKFVKQ